MFRHLRIAFLTFILLTSVRFSGFSQYYDLHWYIGNGGLLDFTTGGAPAVSFPGGYFFGECSASATDIFGNLQFFTDGLTAYSSNGLPMPNGSGLLGGNSSTDGALILQRPGTCNQYYLFTLEDHIGAPIDFRYSVIDMTLNGGLGDVVAGQKNILRGTNESEQLTAIPHTNGTDWWVITHPVSSNTFQAWLVTNTGVAATPITSSLGPSYSGTNYIGEMSANHAGTKLAASLTFGSASVYTYDFNASTGIVSNPVQAAAIVNSGPYGLQFSPNDQILYVSCIWVTNRLVQVDVSNPALTNVLITLTGANYLYGKIVEAPDGRIVVARPGQTVLGTINNPNTWGAGASYVPNSIAMPLGFTGGFSLPHYPPALHTSLFTPAQDSAWFTQSNCHTDSTTFDFLANFAFDSIRWDFGDPASGSNNAATTSPVLHVFSGPGTYNVQLFIHGCHPDTLPLTVTVNPPLTVDLGNDTTLCQGSSLSLSALPAIGTYVWSDGSTNPTLSVNSGGTYAVTVTDGNGCSESDTIVVQFIPSFTVNLGPDQTLCPGTIALLDAGNPGMVYSWNTGANTQTLSSSTPGQYQVTVTDGSGCQTADTVLLQYFPAVIVNLGPDQNFCPGATATLDAGNPGASYAWNTGATTQTLSTGTPGTYSVTVTDGNGCAGIDTVLLGFSAVPVVNLGPDLTDCQGPPAVVLNAGNPGANYQWSTGQTTQSISITNGGYYSVTVTFPGGCSASDTVGVTVWPSPNVNFGPPRRICAGESVVLNASNPGSTYLWNTGATTQTITVSTGGNYSVTVTNSFGCTDDDDVQVQVRPLPTVNLGPDRSICPGQVVLLNPGPAGGGGGGGGLQTSYAWNTGAGSTTLSTSTPGMYIVTVTQTSGGGGGGGGGGGQPLSCQNTDTIFITQLPAPQVNLGPDRFFCEGNDITLSIGNTPGTIQWSDGSTGSSLLVNQTGTYWVQVTSSNGCTGRDTVQATESPSPVVEITGNPHFCEGDSTQLNAGNPGSTFLWSNGQSTQHIWVNQTGTYAVTVTNAAGCRESDGILIRVMEDFAYSLGPDTTLCMEDPLVLGLKIPGSQSIWSNGFFTDFIRVNETGIYSVTVSTACFTHSDTVAVTFLNGPGPYAPNAFTPNNDGINDRFGFIVGPDIADFDLAIFDRWGKMIWQTRDPNQEWDGKYSGTDAPEGVYAYRVQYRNCLGHLTDRGGSVTLMR